MKCVSVATDHKAEIERNTRTYTLSPMMSTLCNAGTHDRLNHKVLHGAETMLCSNKAKCSQGEEL